MLQNFQVSFMIAGGRVPGNLFDLPNHSKPGSLPVRTLTLGWGTGFGGYTVWVRVHLENSRVTRDDHYLENIVTLIIFNPCMVYNSHVYSNSNRNLLSMTGKFGEQIEEFSLFNTCRSLSPPIFLILVWFTIALCIQINVEIYLA